MNARTLACIASCIALLVLGAAGSIVAQDSPPEGPLPRVEGELAFSDALVFDYDRDGTQERVQFWFEFEAQPSESGAASAEGETQGGTLVYYVYDLGAKERVDDWLLGFNMTMGGGFPRANESYPLTNVRITGRKAEFKLASTHFMIIDRGESWELDTIEVTDHNGTRPGRFYGGDVRVMPHPLEVAEPLEIPANQECNACHYEAALSIAAKGGPHRDLECISCHVEHPPDVEHETVANCLSCHESHTASMTPRSCVACHAEHDAKAIRHTVDMPDDYCAACHADSAAQLAESGTLHVGLSCVLCHPGEHGASVGCTYCHKGTHPQHVMRQPEGCWKCHNTAHDTASGH